MLFNFKTFCRVISPWPNTYAFTKALAEDLLRANNKSIPLGIFRPGIGEFYFKSVNFRTRVKREVLFPDGKSFFLVIESRN